MDRYPIAARGMVIAGIVLGVLCIIALAVSFIVFMVLVHGLANNPL